VVSFLFGKQTYIDALCGISVLYGSISCYQGCVYMVSSLFRSTLLQVWPHVVYAQYMQGTSVLLCDVRCGWRCGE
jgi:hypothetical protein